MKRIYVNSETLKEAVDYLNDDITFFGFLSHIKAFIKKLLISPLDANIDEYLRKNGIDKKDLLDKMLERNIIEKETKIEECDGKDKFVVVYKVPKKNFERKIRRLYSSIFEKNEISESRRLTEDGATSCGSAMQAGGLNPDAGQFIKPLEKSDNKNESNVLRRKIHITTEQSKMLKEMGIGDAGDYQYTVPLNFNNGKDPAYNHKNMMAKSFPKYNKKKGIRTKTK